MIYFCFLAGKLNSLLQTLNKCSAYPLQIAFTNCAILMNQRKLYSRNLAGCD